MRIANRIILSGLLAAALAVPALARAEDNESTPNTDHADRATLTLPSHASDTAKANAFGQQGERQKAAHAAAKAAAAQAAGRAATTAAHSGTLPAQASPNAGANAFGANAQAAAGMQRAADAQAAHPRQGPR
jgi:hypothetical protein